MVLLNAIQISCEKSFCALENVPSEDSQLGLQTTQTKPLEQISEARGTPMEFHPLNNLPHPLRTIRLPEYSTVYEGGIFIAGRVRRLTRGM